MCSGLQWLKISGDGRNEAKVERENYEAATGSVCEGEEGRAGTGSEHSGMMGGTSWGKNEMGQPAEAGYVMGNPKEG